MSIRSLKIIIFIGVVLSACSHRRKPSKEFLQMKKMSEQALDTWIRQHALYPDFYKPLHFSDSFGTSCTSKGFKCEEKTQCYKVLLRCQLMDTNKTLQEVTAYYYLDYNFVPNLIFYENKECGCGASPPVIFDWIEKYGKLTAEDSSYYDLENQRMTKELFEKIKN